jgi:hypothetical protein
MTTAIAGRTYDKRKAPDIAETQTHYEKHLRGPIGVVDSSSFPAVLEICQ